MDGRAPARLRLGTRRRVSAPNADGWREILPRQDEGSAFASVECHHDSGPCTQAHKIPAHFHGRCFNCLSHHVVTCRVPRHGLHCRSLGHLTRDCSRSKAAPNGGSRPRHARAATTGPPSERPSVVHQPQMGLRWRRRRRHGGKLMAVITGDKPPASTEDATASTCFLEPDPLAATLC